MSATLADKFDSYKRAHGFLKGRVPFIANRLVRMQNFIEMIRNLPIKGYVEQTSVQGAA